MWRVSSGSRLSWKRWRSPVIQRSQLQGAAGVCSQQHTNPYNLQCSHIFIYRLWYSNTMGSIWNNLFIHVNVGIGMIDDKISNFSQPVVQTHTVWVKHRSTKLGWPNRLRRRNSLSKVASLGCVRNRWSMVKIHYSLWLWSKICAAILRGLWSLVTL